MVAAHLATPILCLVTDRKLLREGGLVECVSKAVKGGVGMVQLREKDMSTPALAALAREVRAVSGESLLTINGDPEAAALAGAAGVHLPEDAMPVAEARRRAGSAIHVGRSVHSVAAATKAEAEGADYLIVGTIFESQSKPGKEPEGLALLKRVTGAVHIPVLGIGGINAANAGQVMEAGASGIAVISAILGQEDPEGSARGLAAAIHAVGSKR